MNQKFLDKYLKEFNQDTKQQIVDLIISHIEEHSSCRAGWAAEQILKRKQPNNVLNKIAASLVESGRYLKEQSKFDSNDWEITKNPNYKGLTKQDEEIAALTYLKLKYDTKNSKRIYQTYWISFGLAIAAFIISVILLSLRLAG